MQLLQAQHIAQERDRKTIRKGVRDAGQLVQPLNRCSDSGRSEKRKAGQRARGPSRLPPQAPRATCSTSPSTKQEFE